MKFKEWLTLNETPIDMAKMQEIFKVLEAEFGPLKFSQIVLDRVTPDGKRRVSPSGYKCSTNFEGRLIEIKIWYDEPYESKPEMGQPVPGPSQHGHGYVEFGFMDQEQGWDDDDEAAPYKVVNPQVRKGSKALLDKFKRIWTQLGQMGVAVSYDPMERPQSQLQGGPASRVPDQRNRLYSKMMTRSGFGLKYQGDNKVVWEPQSQNQPQLGNNGI